MSRKDKIQNNNSFYSIIIDVVYLLFLYLQFLYPIQDLYLTQQQNKYYLTSYSLNKLYCCIECASSCKHIINQNNFIAFVQQILLDLNSVISILQSIAELKTVSRKLPFLPNGITWLINSQGKRWPKQKSLRLKHNKFVIFNIC